MCASFLGRSDLFARILALHFNDDGKFPAHHAYQFVRRPAPRSDTILLQSGCLIALYAIPLFFSASYGQRH